MYQVAVFPFDYEVPRATGGPGAAPPSGRRPADGRRPPPAVDRASPRPRFAATCCRKATGWCSTTRRSSPPSCPASARRPAAAGRDCSSKPRPTAIGGFCARPAAGWSRAKRSRYATARAGRQSSCGCIERLEEGQWLAHAETEEPTEAILGAAWAGCRCRRIFAAAIWSMTTLLTIKRSTPSGLARSPRRRPGCTLRGSC